MGKNSTKEIIDITVGKRIYHINKNDKQLCKNFLKMLEDNQ